MFTALADMWDKDKHNWMLKDKLKSGQKAPKGTPASDEDMLLLQNCNDSITRLTLDIQRMAPQLVKVADSQFTKKIAVESLQLLKAIVTPGETVQNLLMQDKNDLDARTIQKALADAGGPFEELMEVHKVVKKHVIEQQKKLKASRCSH